MLLKTLGGNKMLNQSEILTLSDNKKYSVVFTTRYNTSNYVYLIDQDDYTNTMFCKYDNNNRLEEVEDSNIIEELLKLFLQS
jgi:hypothetical protein